MQPHDRPQLDPDSWVDDYGDALYGFALARVKNSGEAEELVQETYYAALRSRKSFKGTSSEKTWLFGILKHKIFDHFRKAHKAPLANRASPSADATHLFLGTHGSQPAGNAAPGTDPEHAYHYMEFLDHLRRCLATLPRRSAQVFISREIDGLSTEEICQIFSISKYNCWTILHRTKTLLRHRLALYGFKPLA